MSVQKILRAGAAIGRNGARALADRRGGVSMLFGLALLPVVAGVGLAVDVGAWHAHRTTLQTVADASALTGAREMRIIGRDATALELRTHAAARQAMVGHGIDPDDVRVAVTADPEAGTLDITLRGSHEGTFSRLVGIARMDIAVAATARLSGTLPICAIALETQPGSSLWLRERARVDARNCAVFSNGSGERALRIDDDASVSAGLICSAGGARVRPASVSPQPRTDCPKTPDPLAARGPGTLGSCTVQNARHSSDVRLSPGVFCGGLRLNSGARVELQPGVYVIRDGDLVVDDGVHLSGQYVTFVLEGTSRATNVRFAPTSRVSLTASKDGAGRPALAGFLFHQTAGSLPMRFLIESNDARVLLGTVYLPNGDIQISAGGAVADRSAFTVIVARTIALDRGPTLTLNTNYHETDIPVPEGVGPVGTPVLAR